MTIGFTAGAFDLLHPGHLAFLSVCKEHCDTLFVGLHVDPSIERIAKNKPVQSMFERFIQLDACVHVDQIIPYETEDDLRNMLAILAIDIRFLGSEYDNTDLIITGSDICYKRDIETIFVPRLHTYSSSELRSRLEKLPDCTRADEITAKYFEKYYSKGFATGGIGKADVTMTMTEGFNISPGVKVTEYDD